MDSSTTYFDVLRRRWWVLLLGLVVALVAGFLSAYTIEGSKPVAKSKPTHTALARVFVESPTDSLFETATTDDASRPIGYTPQELAEIYPYLVIGDEVRAAIEEKLGRPMRSPESITATRPLSQPEIRLRDAVVSPLASPLPIIEISATAGSADTARSLTQVAVDAFIEYVEARQDAEQVPLESRVVLAQTEQPRWIGATGSGPAGTFVLWFLAVFTGFVLLAFVVDGFAQARARSSEARLFAVDDTPAPLVYHAPPDPISTWPIDERVGERRLRRERDASEHESPAEQLR